MKSLLSFMIVICCTINLFSQINKAAITNLNNGLEISFNFSQEFYSLIKLQKGSLIKYTSAVDESNPGRPALPSKTIFIAIPPYSEVKMNLEYQKYNTINNAEIDLNPEISLGQDSSLVLQKSQPDLKAFITDNFPGNELELLGYSWIRDYYCAVIKINTHRYDWKKKEIKELLSTNLNIEFENAKPFMLNTNPIGEYDKSLKDIIINFETASSFRSFNLSNANSDSTGNWIDYSKEYIKMGIGNDGIYNITYQDLLNIGLNVNQINPKTFKLFIGGIQKPIYVNGEDDQVFDSGDYIEFWANKNYQQDYRQIVPMGTDYINYLNRYTDTTYVWLTWNGTDGLRTSIVDTQILGLTDTVKYHQVKLHFESDVRLWYYDDVQPRTQLPFWQEHKVWTWRTIQQNQTSSFNFVVSNQVLNTEVKTISRLISNAIDTTINTHKFSAGLNNLPQQDTIEFNYRETVNLASTFDSNTLLNGTNTYKIFGLPTAAAYHRALMDWVDIDFFRYNYAFNDSLKIINDSSIIEHPSVIEINNVNEPDSTLLIYKISGGSKRFFNFNRLENSIYFTDTVKGGDVYVLLKKSLLKTPKFYEKKQFIDLRDVSRGADYILLTNRELNSSATNYLNFIENNYNTRNQLIFVNDIFDEFGYGFPEPESIKRFIEYTNLYWQAPKPSFLTIIGDAKYDYKNVIVPPDGRIRKNLVPSYGFPVSDIWYTTIYSGNINIPQMFVGRIPAENNGQVEFYLQKHQKYLQRRYDDWNKNFLFFSGGDINDAVQLQNIYNANQNLFNNIIKPIPIGGIGTHFYKTINPPSNLGPYTQEEIDAALNKGSLLISYIGHSGTQTWDNGITDVGDIKNSYDNRLPMISDFGCSTGKFAEPDVDAFGELFLTGDVNGQAISYLGNSSWGYTSTSFNFPDIFYNKLLLDSNITIGSAHILSKINLFNESGFSVVNRVFNYCNFLFSDPIIQVKTPLKSNFVINTNSISLLEKDPNDLLDSVEVKFLVQNWGKAHNDSLDVNFIESWQDSVVYSKQFKILIPLFETEISIKLPVKSRVGDHAVAIELDKPNLYDEIYEDDNLANFKFTIFSTSIRPIQVENYYNSIQTTVDLLNPNIKLENLPEEILLSLSENPEFTNPQNWIVPFDTLRTIANFSSLLNNQRYWWRAKISSNEIGWSNSFSFKTINNSYNWFIDESFDKNDITYNHVVFDSAKLSWVLQTSLNSLEVASAGFSDGEFGSVKFNGSETLPTTYYWGIATAEIDSITLQPSNYKYFLYWDNSPADSMRIYLDSLSQGSIIAITICTDGAQSVLNRVGGPLLRQTIKSFGSAKIDSVQYRDSWSFIGVKGAQIGSVPESFKKSFFGVATSDTGKSVEYDSGELLLPTIGKASSWQNVVVTDSLPIGSNLRFIPLGIKQNNQVDTLNQLSFNADSASIYDIDAKIYSQIKFLVKFYASSLKKSPELKTLGVNFIPPSRTCN